MFQKSCTFDEFLIKYFAVDLIIYSDMIQEKQKKISKCLEFEAIERKSLQLRRLRVKPAMTALGKDYYFTVSRPASRSLASTNN